MQDRLGVRIQTEVKVTDIYRRHFLWLQGFWLRIWAKGNRDQSHFSVSLLNAEWSKLDVGWQRLQTTLGLDCNIEGLCLSGGHFKG